MSHSLQKPHNHPLFYRDSLPARAENMRYRQIGSPYFFLNGIGIDAILEVIYKGANIVDVAKQVNVSIGVLLAWLENEGHMSRVEDAYKFSAEGYLSEASNLLREAKTDFELKKAKELTSHARFMASKMDKGKYGGDSKQIAGDAVQFIMHIGQAGSATLITGSQNQRAPLPAEIVSEPGIFSIIPSPELPIPKPRASVAAPDSIGPFEPEPFDPDPEAIPEYLRPLNPYEAA